MHRRISIGLFLIIFINTICSSSLCGQENNIVLKNIGLPQGLSQNSVLCILKDREGFMWFGTQDGLNKYDGYTFTTYLNNPKDPYSISSNYIQCLFEDNSGTIWIGTWGGGLNRFDKNKETFISFKHEKNNPKSLSNNDVNAICEDLSGKLWVGTKSGLNRFNPEKGNFGIFLHDDAKANSLSCNDVSALYLDRFGVIWAATLGGGLNRYNIKSHTFTRFNHNPGNSKSLSHDIVRSIYKDNSGTMWVGTWGALNKYNPTKENFTVYKSDPGKGQAIGGNYISSILEDNRGTFWVGTWGGGLSRFDKKSGKFTPVTQELCNPDNFAIISKLYADTEGNIWMGTMGNGIYIFHIGQEPFITYRNLGNDSRKLQSLSNDDVKAIFADSKGIIWIGTEGGGLNRFDPITKRFTVFKSKEVFKDISQPFAGSGELGSNSIHSIYEDSKGMFWIGSGDTGLNLFDRNKGTFKAFMHDEQNSKSLSNNDVRAIYEDSKGNFWVGTWGGGLNLFDRNKNTFKSLIHNTNDLTSLSDNFISCIFEDRQGTLWVGTQQGLNKYNPENSSFQIFHHNTEDEGSLSSSVIFSLCEDSKGNLWLGTQKGLTRINRTDGKVKSYNENDGFTGSAIYGIIEDEKKYLWVSTDKGISKFNPTTESVLNFDISDGLQSNIFNPGSFEKAPDGTFYFGGIAGFSHFNPNHISGNIYVPPIAIGAFKIFNKPMVSHSLISSGKPLQISYKDAFFTIEFSALSFFLPEKNRYKYKLEGFDKEWVMAGTKREASYTNLDGGTYTFYVKGSNNNGLWSKESRPLQITIIPPWWQMLWFKVGSALFLVAAVLLGYRFTTNRIISRNKELEGRVAERTYQIELQKREIELNRDNLNKLNLEISDKNEELERKVEERTRELRSSEQQLRLITDALPVLIAYIDKDLRFRFNNKTYEEWFRIQREDIHGKYIWEVIGEEAYYKIKEYIDRTLEGEIINYEIELPYKNVGEHFISTFYIPHIEAEEVVGFYALITDISERKKIEEALAKTLEQSEHNNKELIRINADLDNFVYTASHDLRAPITNLEGLQHLLESQLEDRLNDGDKQIFEFVGQSILRLKRTIGELGEIAKIQKEVLPEEALSFQEIIQEVKADIAPLILEENAIIEEDLEIDFIHYPHKHLRSIVYNLLSNAIKYRSPDRDPIIRIVTRKTSDALLLSIEDNGLGLDETQIEKLFKMFKRLHTHVEGTGIGLYMVKRIIENNGGRIEVQSSPGEGSTFNIYFDLDFFNSEQ